MFDYGELFRVGEDLRLQRMKMFQHDGPRSAETDVIAETAAAHVMLHEWPDIQEITFTWTHHNIPDMWLLFVTGHTALKEK